MYLYHCLIPPLQMRSLGCAMLMIGYDAEDGAQVFRVDPAGYYRNMRGAGLGVKSTSIKLALEKKCV